MKQAFLVNSFNIAGLILAISDIWYTIVSGGLKSLRRRLYLHLLFGIAFSAITSIGSYFLEPNVVVAEGKTWLYFLREGIDCLYFFVHITMGALFALHIVVYLGAFIWRSRWVYFFYFLPLFVCYVLVAINPAVHLLFEYIPVDGVWVYSRGPLMFILYAVNAGYALFGILMLIVTRKGLTPALRAKLVALYCVSFFGIGLQGAAPFFNVEIFCEAVTMTGILLILEDRRKEMDPTSLGLNQAALVGSFRRLVVTKHKFSVMTVRLDNLPHYARILSSDDRSLLLRKVAKFLLETTHAEDVYRAGGSCLVVMLEDKEAAILRRYAEEVRDFLASGISVEAMDIALSATVALANVPEEIPSVDALLNLLELPEDQNNRDFVLIQGEDLAFLERKLAIEKILRNAIREKKFELYYQPIYDPTSKKFAYAEALVRLHSDELGFIPPMEFIPIAEKSGLIGEIGRQIFTMACEFVGSIDMAKHGLKYIEVNLSPIQLYAKDLADELLLEMNRNGVLPSQINLEVTEAAALSSSKASQENIKRLLAHGLTFSLDDFGSGYANFKTLTALPFTNIKLDMDILKAMKDDEHYRRVYAGMVKALSPEADIIQEGVETKEVLDWLLSLNPDMKIQGYYFAKPMPAQEFLKFLEEHR